MGLFSEISKSLSDLKNNMDEAKDKLYLVQKEAEKVQKIGQEIQTKIDEFKFSIEGNLAVINEISKKYIILEKSNKEKTPRK
ncbi:hypothetical protein [Lactovum miscens]|uniref:Putative nuclease with TOPRIM domain n=1 Tax=Lactovum miscens TaxID=190387 RepID=A0A841C6M6_9LACT|nr:hypothetical protein [Lactovum miscens]MBB5887252.1 putative nuclease with TOPRIM domain [Lactovum miscens]